MSKKKKGVLQFTAKDCRKKNEQLRERCDYAKIAKAIGEINTHIKEYLADGETEVRIGRILNNNVLPVLIYTYDWEHEDSEHLSDLEWGIIVRQLNDAGFTINIDERSDYINLSW